jgi:hypothetical protein
MNKRNKNAHASLKELRRARREIWDTMIHGRENPD